MLAMFSHFGQGVGDDGIDIPVLAGQQVDEGGIGAVFQQATHQVGQQVLVLADRRVDPATITHRPHHLLV